MGRRLRIAVGLTALGLVAGACGDTGNVTEPTPAMCTAAATATSQPTTMAAVAAVVDEVFLAEQVDKVSIPESGGAFMVAVVADEAVVYAANGTDPEGNPLTPDSPLLIAGDDGAAEPGVLVGPPGSGTGISSSSGYTRVARVGSIDIAGLLAVYTSGLSLLIELTGV